MGQTYTEQAERAIKLAKQFASESHHSYIGTEHLLVGLVREWEGTAGKILEEYGVTDQKLIELIRELIASGTVVEKEEQKMSPRTESVLQDARNEAEAAGVKTGTEHILLAMLRESGCVAARLLHTMGVSVQKLYVSTLSAMGYDNEAIKVEMEGLGLIGYVANSPNTVQGESYSAGRLYDKIGDTAEGKVMYVLPKGVLAFVEVGENNMPQVGELS